jgi:hypothetical protein
VENIIRSLLKQLLCLLTLIPPKIESLYDDCRRKSQVPTSSQLTDQLHEVIASCKASSVFFVLDALDECLDHCNEIITMISALDKLGVKVFCTSRPHLIDLPKRLGTTAVLEVRAQDDDVRNYLSVRLKDWKFSESRFKPMIIDRLSNDVDGKSVSNFKQYLDPKC